MYSFSSVSSTVTNDHGATTQLFWGEERRSSRNLLRQVPRLIQIWSITMQEKGNINEMVATNTPEAPTNNGDAAEAESSNNNSNDDGILAVTMDATALANNNSSENNGRGVQRRFVSRHRKALDHIAVDASQAYRHDVPSPLNNNPEGGDDFSSRASFAAASGQIGGKFRASCQSAVADMDSWDSLIEKLLPMTRWIKGYSWKETFIQDLISGCTVGVMIVPQSMSYAKLAGLPVEYGLYSALVPVFAYACFGSSRQLAVGPVALISLLLSTGVSHILANDGYDPSDENYQAKYNQLAVQMSFLVGVTNIFMGLFRLGFITVFLSHAVISGFTSKLHRASKHAYWLIQIRWHPS